MKNYWILCIVLLCFNYSYSQKKYVEMIKDNSINFYDVVNEAENYFNSHDKTLKGSGWKGYQRWKNANEYKYYPSGNRSNINPFFNSNEYQTFIDNNQIIRSSYDNGWEELGPLYITNITGAYSTGLGRVEDHYVDPTNENLMYLGSRSGGFWKTIDGGTNWTGGSTDFLPACGVNTIGVSPLNSNNILINIRNSQNGYSHGIYRSIDGGENWTLSNFNPANVGFGGLGDNFRIYEIRYHPRVDNLIFIGTSRGIYRSDDNLATWTQLIPSGDIEEIQFHPINNNIIYLYDSYYWGSNKNYVMRSINQGLSYSQSSMVAGNNDNRSVHLSVSASCSNCLYFASDNGVWKSIDNGVNFTFLNNPPQGCGGFAVNDLDNTKMIYGYVDIEASTDDGATFNQVTHWSLGNTNGDHTSHQTSFETSTDYVHADLHPAKSVNGVFYVGTDGLFCKSSDNGSTWEIISQGTGIRENYSLGVSQSNHYRSISGSQDNGTSIKTENGWIEFFGADGMEGIIHPLNDDWMIGSFQFGGRRRTKDGGQTQDGVTPPANEAYWEAPIAYDPNNQMVVYDFRDYVYKSEDFGSTWNSVGSPSFSGDIIEAVISENNSNIMIVSQYEKIEKSIDGGNTFINIKGSLPDLSIQDIAFDPNDDNVIIVTYGAYQIDNNKVFISIDGGSSWSNITYNLGNMPIRTVVIDHTNESNIYLGGEIGVYTKPMNATTWTLYNPNLSNTTVSELEIIYGSNSLKAATWGRGLWEYTIVGRNDYPSILTTTINDKPTDSKPKEGVEQFITSTIEYDGTLSNVYVEWSINTPVFDNIIQMHNTAGTIWISDSSIPDYPVGTKIYFRVKASGSNNDTSETYKFMYTVKPFDYCDATGNSDSGNLYLSNVTITGQLNNNSGNTSYQYYNSPETELVINTEYDLSLSANTGWSSNDFAAWIDFNNDTEFDNSEQILFEPNSGSYANALFTIPENAKTNETLRMRVRLSYWDDSPDICGNDFGEVEDYAINIVLNSCPDGTTNFITGSWDNGNPSIGKSVLFKEDYDTSANGNVTACSCEVETGNNVTVNAGGYIEVKGNIKIDGSLEIEHGGSVVQVDDDAVTINNGSIQVTKKTPTLRDVDFTILGSPMTGETREDVYAGAAIVRNHITANFVPYSNGVPAADNWADDNGDNWLTHIGALVPGAGYLVKPQLDPGGSDATYQTDYTEGTLNSGDITFTPVMNGGVQDNSPNILSNPYASGMNINDFLITNGDAGSAVYFWEHRLTPDPIFPGYDPLANYDMDDISYHNGTIGTGSVSGSTIPGDEIPSGQGFGIKPTAATPITFSNSMRRTANTGYRNSEALDILRVEVSNKTYGLKGHMALGFTEATTNEMERLDIKRLATSISLFSVVDDNELGIQMRSVFNEDQIIPLGFHTFVDETQTYTISLSDVEGELISQATVYLKDNLLNNVTNLSETDYVFTSNVGYQTNRFVLIFTEDQLGTNDLSIESISLYPNPTQNILNIVSPQAEITSIEVYDVRGRLIDNAIINFQRTYQLDMSILESAMYFVTINTEKGSIIKGIVKK